MTQDIHPQPDEERLAALLRGLETDAAEPDRHELLRIQELATAAFLEAIQAGDGQTPPASESSNTSQAASRSPLLPRAFEEDRTESISEPCPEPFKSPAPRKRGRTISGFGVRVATIFSTIAAVIVLWLNLSGSSSVAQDVPFGEVVARLQEAQTLEFRIVRGEQTSQLWIKPGSAVRWEESPQQYQIANGSRLWKVDEAQNTVTDQDSPWFESPQQPVNLLKLLDLESADSGRLLATRPMEQVDRQGQDVLLYQLQVNRSPQSLDVVAEVDRRTLRLLRLTARRRTAGKPVDPPLAEIQLVAIDRTVADDKFVVASSLSQDGRLGKVNRAEGLVGLRPLLAERWTPLQHEVLLKPGDWLRTELRGANAVLVTLTSGVELTAGPGTLLELLKPDSVRLHTGVVQIKTPVAMDAKSTFVVFAPREGARTIAPGDRQLLRVTPEDQLADLSQPPGWLVGFEGSSPRESLGSLLVHLPDGRNEPLSVGYHKVQVEIRDQIARTTIEESFVNHTNSRLEGVFHFPLPADASISGFGMWIGNELVEADVVEKQRAREIYETILREKRDPGLLEWAGGNLFKARVFPIEPNAEKRVKIVYTQVLPLRGQRFRYAYNLRSELLRNRPLRELEVSVRVASALPLQKITCPNFPARIVTGAESGTTGGQTGPFVRQADQHRTTGSQFHAAKIEYVAQEIAPERDFELICELAGDAPEVVVVPHQRGNDGYLLVQVRPPVQSGILQRAVLENTPPLKLVLLCDTSASMDRVKRQQQADVIRSILASLGPHDQFLLGACDVDVSWASDAWQTPGRNAIESSETFLAQRMSLGWTDLDRAFAGVFKKVSSQAHVIYVGDGQRTAGEPSPIGFLQNLEQSRTATENGAAADALSLHVISVGNTVDTTVLKGIASAGRGTYRQISADSPPQTVTLELLQEIAQPGLRDLKIEFQGLKVAAVYPERLPNLPSGSQQILVGRYLPTGASQTGEVIVSGVLDGQPVRYAARVSFADAEQGNSFIPRLWARGHLDHLLAQGTSEFLRDEVVRLSEDFHIMTPYTSLLVLETDADRERFRVRRRYEMRDGEQFFADGSAAANFELLQQQMKQATAWRAGLRQRVLAQLSQLGRDFNNLNRSIADSSSRHVTTLGLNTSNFYTGMRLAESRRRSAFDDDFEVYDLEGDVSRGQNSEFDVDLKSLQSETATRSNSRWFDVSPGERPVEFNLDPFSMDALEAVPQLLLSSVDTSRLDPTDQISDTERFHGRGGDFSGGAAGESFGTGFFTQRQFGRDSLSRSKANLGWSFQFDADGISDGRYGQQSLTDELFSYRTRGVANVTSSDRHDEWLKSLFPLAAPFAPESVRAGYQPTHWPDQAVELARSLLRVDALRSLSGGLVLDRKTRYLMPAWKRTSTQSSQRILYSPRAWMTIGRDPGTHRLISSCNGQALEVYSLDLQLGSRRPASPADLQRTVLPDIGDGALHSLAEKYRQYEVKVLAKGEGRQTLSARYPGAAAVEHFVVDTVRHVLVERSTIVRDQIESRTVFSDFIEIGGAWWAQRAVTTDVAGQPTIEDTLSFQELDSTTFDQRMMLESAEREQVLFLDLPFRTPAEAREKFDAGVATASDLLILIAQASTTQSWDEAFTRLESLENMASDKPGRKWVRLLLEIAARRHPAALAMLSEEAARIVANPNVSDLYLTEWLLNHAYPITGWSEYLQLVESFRPVFDRQVTLDDEVVDIREHKAKWEDRLAQAYDSLQRPEDALVLREAQARELPWAVARQTQYARALAAAGETASALMWLKTAAQRPERGMLEVDELKGEICELWRQLNRWPELLTFTSEWIKDSSPQNDNSTRYAQHLSALLLNDQQDEAFRLVGDWLTEADRDGDLTDEQRARLEASLTFAHRSLPGLQIQRHLHQWNPLLAKAARQFLHRPDRLEYVGRLMSIYYFQSSDEADQLRGEWLVQLQRQAATDDIATVQLLVDQTLTGRLSLPAPIDGRRQLDAAEVPLNVWERIADQLHQRWTSSADSTERRRLADCLTLLYRRRLSATRLLPFFREQLAAAKGAAAQQIRHQLLSELLQRPWTEALEIEALTLLSQLELPLDEVLQTPSAYPARERRADLLTLQLPLLYRTVESLLSQRMALIERQIRDEGGDDKRTPQERAARTAELRRLSRQQLADRLSQLATVEGPLADWYFLEQSWLDVPLDRNLDQIAERCWKLIDVPELAEDGTETSIRLVEFQRLAQDRALLTLMNLAARKGANSASVDRLLNYLDRQSDLDETSGLAPRDPVATDLHPLSRSTAIWKIRKFQLLVALDRADDLESELRRWIQTDSSSRPWQNWLAMLLAERGKLSEAVSILEELRRQQRLGAADLWRLSQWYTALGQRAEADGARRAVFELLPENQLQGRLYAVLQRWRNPSASFEPLDETLFLTLRALFQKSTQPERHLSAVRELYDACRDFRLLRMLPDVLMGHTAEKTFQILESLQSTVLPTLRQEATVDVILQRIQELRAQELTPADRRALDLMQVLIERKMSELANQPDPHQVRCLAALQRIGRLDIPVSEAVYMSQFLSQLQHLPTEALQQEQLQQLQRLQSLVPAVSRSQLRIALRRGALLAQAYKQGEKAAVELEVAFRDYEAVHGGRWPFADHELLGEYVQLLQGMNRSLTAETLLQRYLGQSRNELQRLWMRQRLRSLYQYALEQGQSVSLGTTRDAIFKTFFAQLEADLLKAATEQQRHELVLQMQSAVRAASRHHIERAPELTRRLAFEVLPQVLRQQHLQYHATAAAPSRVIQEILGSTAAVQYLVERFEQEPPRSTLSGENFWNLIGYDLSRWRDEIRNEALDARLVILLKSALARLLRDRDSGYGYLLSRGSGAFWQEKADIFALVAEEVLSENPQSGRLIMQVTRYLHQGLGKSARAIEIALQAQQAGWLEDAAQVEVLQWLTEERRYAEQIPILESLVIRYPNVMQYRAQLIVAYHFSQRHEQSQTLLEQSDRDFHRDGLWNEDAIERLTAACFETQKWEATVRYSQELIARHLHDRQMESQNDAVLSAWYQRLARAESHRKQAMAAIDAASAAIVCWGPRQKQRDDAQEVLLTVLREATDLSQVVTEWNKRVAQSQQDSPLIRKSLGQVYFERKAFAAAVEQLQLALEIQPNDAELHRNLIAALDARGDRALALQQLRKLIDLQPQDLENYRQLADRLQGDELNSERAVTSIVDAAPLEAESHAFVAEQREKQNRWSDAIEQWQQVAELRRLEPTGLVRLIRAQIHEKRWSDARESWRRLQRTDWPSRFSNVPAEILELDRQITAGQAL